MGESVIVSICCDRALLMFDLWVQLKECCACKGVPNHDRGLCNVGKPVVFD